jgi:glycosyltransferase involved in cell wall biosynthesis
MKKAKVAILTNFQEFNPGYSLTGIVQDQVKMLQDNGHPVKLFVNSQYRQSDDDKIQFNHNVSSALPDIELCRDIPFSHLVDYSSTKDLSDHHKEIVKEVEEMLLRELNGINIVFTHDFIFTGWFLPYGLGVIEASKKLPNTRFYHWIHSTPSTMRDWWDFNSWDGRHKIIFPNKTERVRIAEQYRTMPENIACIHHIKDLRTWCDFCTDSNDFIKDHPAMFNADIVKVYPVSSDRFGAKGVEAVIRIFEKLKSIGHRVCLVIANQWATGRQRQEDVQDYIDLAMHYGLEPGKEFIFTSLWQDGKYNTGIPKNMLRDLMACSNLFIFPTREESFGLAGIEIALSTAAVVVTNRSLSMMNEIHFGETDSHHFGSFSHTFTCGDLAAYYNDIAALIHSALQHNSVVRHRTILRQRYNWNFLYRYEYLPLFTDWSK